MPRNEYGWRVLNAQGEVIIYGDHEESTSYMKECRRLKVDVRLERLAENGKSWVPVPAEDVDAP